MALVMRVGELVNVAKVPTVVQLSLLDDLRRRLDIDGVRPSAPTREYLRRVVDEYLVEAPENDAALRAVLGSLSRDVPSGDGFLISGAHGSGKTHLLALLALLAEYQPAREAFAHSHPQYDELLAQLGARRRLLVVPISLDQHRGESEHLEDIVFDLTEAELRRAKYDLYLPLSQQSYALDLIDRHVAVRHLADLDGYVHKQSGQAVSWSHLRSTDPAAAVHLARQFLDDIQYPLDFRQSRAQRLGRLLEVLERSGFRGVLWLVDELSMFLGSMTAKALHSDCSFLQFLGQRTQQAPLWFVGAMRPGLPELDELDAHVLTQIRERYHTGLQLSAEQTPRVIQERVIRKPDPAKLDEAIARLYSELKARLGQLGFSAQELAASYPLHPTTMACLGLLARRVFSHTRAAVDFAQAQVAGDAARGIPGILDQDFRRLLGPDALFDHFREAMADDPELGPLVVEAYDHLSRQAPAVLGSEAEFGLRLVRAVVAVQAAGVDSTVECLAQSVLPQDRRSGDPYERVQDCLERLRLRVGFMDVRRQEGRWTDAYVVQRAPRPEARLRQEVVAAKSSLADDDPRIYAYAMEAAADGDFPIGGFATHRTITVEWENTPRLVGIGQVALESLTPAALTHVMTALSEEGSLEACRIFVGSLLGPQAQLEHWAQICDRTPRSRWRHALIAWVPRGLSASEVDILKDYAALRLLPRGASAQPSDSEAAAAESLRRQAGALVAEAYAAGTVVTGGQAVIRRALAALRGDWQAALERVMALACEQLFPRFREVAPQAKLPEEGDLARLADDILRSADPSDLQGVDQRLVAVCLGPMALATADEGRMSLELLRGVAATGAARPSPVAEVAAAYVSRRDRGERTSRGAPVPLGGVLGHLAKSELGLPRPLGRLGLAVMVRLGLLEAVDAAQKRVVVGPEAGASMDAVSAVRRPPLLAHDEWQELARLGRGILDEGVLSPDLTTQQRLWERFAAHKRTYSQRLADIEVGLDDLCGRLEQSREQWQGSYEALELARAFFACVDPALACAEGLRELLAGARQLFGAEAPTRAGLPAGRQVQELLAALRHLAEFLEHTAPALLAVYRYAQRAEVPEAPRSPLPAHRRRLLEFVAGGERAVTEETTLRRLEQSFVSGYVHAYLSWHQRWHTRPQLQQHHQLRSLPAYRALAQMAKLPLGGEAVLRRIVEAIEGQLRGQCTNPDLRDDLRTQPVCPRCRLRLAEEPEEVPAAQMAEAIQQALAQQLRALGQPEVRQALAAYAQSAPSADLGRRLCALPDLGPEAEGTVVLSALTDDVVGHAARALQGRRLETRRLADLEDLLKQRTLPKAELRQALREWLADADLADEDLLYIE